MPHRGERVAQFVGERGEELVLAPVGLLQRDLRRFAFGDVAGRAGHRFDLAVGPEHRHEDVIVDAPAVVAGERHLAANRLPGRDDLIDFLVVHGGVPRLIAEFQAVLADRLVPTLAPHSQQ